MKIKRLLALIMTLTLVLLAGCGGGSDPAPTTNTEPPATDAGTDVPDADAGDAGADSDLKIGFSLSIRSDQFLSMMEAAAIEYAEGLGVSMTAFDAQNDVQKQLDHMTTFASQGFDAIIVNLVDTSSTEAVINAASGIPVIFVNRMPEDQYIVEGQVATVGSDEEQSGTLQGEFIADYFADKDPKELDYVMIMGTLGLQHTTKRTEFPISTLEAKGFTMNKVFEDTADYDRATAMEKMQQFLGTGKSFDVVFCNNDEMALGCIEAMRVAGGIDVPVVGIDATQYALEAIEKGELACSVFQNAIGQGEGSVDVALKAARGESFDTYNWIPFELVTIDNLADYK